MRTENEKSFIKELRELMLRYKIELTDNGSMEDNVNGDDGWLDNWEFSGEGFCVSVREFEN